MAIEGGSSGQEGKELVSSQPSAKDFPMNREMDAQTLADLGTFSEPAIATIQDYLFEDARNLVRASVVVKERVKGDCVAAANVQEAYIDLHKHDPQEGNGFVKLAGILGGLFSGTSLSTVGTMFQYNQFTKNGTVLAVLTGIVGAFLIALDLAKRYWRKRKPPHSR